MSATWDSVHRCDRCDNGMLKGWEYCPFCGHPQTDEGLAELDRLTKLQRLATPDPAEVRGRIRWGANSFGMPGRALFIGNICAGHILDDYTRTKEGGPEWRAWIMRKDDVGEDLGWFGKDVLARAALVAAVREAIQTEETT